MQTGCTVRPFVSAAPLRPLSHNPYCCCCLPMQGACCSKDADGQHTCSETLPDACTGGFMPRSTCTQKNICALAPESGIFGEDEIAPSDANLEAFEQISFAASKLEKLGKGACCLDEQCIDNIKKEHCSGVWSNGQSCNAVQCGAFRIASASGTELPKGAVNPAGMLLGSCCVDGQCMEGVESDCAGIWNSGAKCSDIDCARSDSIPRGACCNPQDGSCADGVEETACPAPAKWTKDGKCQPNGVCTGACCDGGKCSQKLKQDCPGEWTLYKDCKLDTCPRPAGFVAVASVSLVSATKQLLHGWVGSVAVYSKPSCQQQPLESFVPGHCRCWDC